MSVSSQSARNQDASHSRLQIDYLSDPEAIAKDDIRDAIEGLQQSPKSLPPRYFYDAKGSQLFEQICELPEYYPTRTEAKILKQYAAEIIDRTQAPELIELGSGSSTKTRYLLDVYRERNLSLTYVPVDVSGSMLSTTAKDLLNDYPLLEVRGKVATYSQALEQLEKSSRKNRDSKPKIIVFLGSSIGNFSPKECDRFLQQIESALNPGDYLLLGIDLQKPADVLTAAYNDTQGVTAAFNLNMLQHLNHRFAGDFCLASFQHQAIYNAAEHQIEMYLVSQETQTVNLTSLNLTVEFARQEKMLTEISRKFDLAQMTQQLSQHRLQTLETYTDQRQWFGLLLCQLG